MFLEATTHTKNNSCTFYFRSSRSLISFRSSLPFLKMQEIYSKAATFLLKHKKYIQKQLHKFFTVSVQNIHFLCEDFHNPSMIMKNIFDGWFQESNTVIRLHLCWALTPILGILGKFQSFCFQTIHAQAPSGLW